MLERMTKRNIAVYCGVGLCAGFLAGFFGIGGGSVIVPTLVALGFSQRSAAATSLLSILPTAASGVIAYIVGNEIDYVVAALLACGAVVGAQIGTRLLNILPETFLRWFFAVFILAISAMQFIMVPSRGTDIALGVSSAIGLVALGLATGTLSGLLGIGGGFLVITGLTFAFGGSDIAARGTSLLMMIPGTISGTIQNVKNGLTDIRVGLIIGGCACATTPVGKVVLERCSPKAAAVLVGAYLVALFIRSVYVATRKRF
jgi:uncharacterized membrane protein YfcA